jgi:hypothetical protein
VDAASAWKKSSWKPRCRTIEKKLAPLSYFVFVFFAGEATSLDGHNGAVHGAMTSVNRAAKELLRAIQT